MTQKWGKNEPLSFPIFTKPCWQHIEFQCVWEFFVVVVVVNVSYYELRSVFVARLIFSCAKVRASKQTTTNEVKVFSMCMNKIKLCECIYSMFMFVCTIQPMPISKLYTHG